jgi:hypothetical protein
VLDTTTGERIPYWAELDAQAPEGDQVLIVHPASSLPEGHHFIVAMRDLLDADGNAIERTPAFQAALDQDPEPLERARTLREMLEALDAHGIDPQLLYVAWEFTVASQESLSGRLLHIRDEAYAELGDGAPAFTVVSAVDDGAARTIDGTFDVPNYLTGDGSPGNRFSLAADGLPERNADQPLLPVPFHCVAPVAPAEPVPAIVFGHGLMGDRGQADGLSFAAPTASPLFVRSTDRDEHGRPAEPGSDPPDLALPEQADRMQQGHLNQQYLGRLLNSPEGFVTTRRSRPPTAHRSSPTARPSSWATARAASPRRGERSAPSGIAVLECPASVTHCCCPARATGRSSRRSSTRPIPTPPTA